MNNAWSITGPINHVWALEDQQQLEEEEEATTLLFQRPPTRTCSRTIQGSCRKLRHPLHAKVTAITIIIIAITTAVAPTMVDLHQQPQVGRL